MEDSSSEVQPDSDDSSSSLSLSEAIAKYEIDVPAGALEPLEAYCAALWDWNTRINLTRHTNFDLFVRRDLLDTVKLAEHIPQGQDVLDIGSGGGVPGLVLGIIRPDLNISVCDSVAKKAKVLEDIVRRLELPIPVHSVRAQIILEDMRYHTLVTRAAGSLRQLLNWLQDSWLSFDRLLAIKGPRWVEERKEARHRGLLNGIELHRVSGYTMPGYDSESVILSLERKR